jgi:ubiquinone/menaquinone biosynthesis C-methylase UbiE
MADTLTPEKWGNKESADWWSAGQAARQQLYGAATEMMLDLASVKPGSRVLDVAAGTGESTLMAAARVGSKGHVVAADVSASMLNVAAEAARKEGLTNVETRVMNAENLELEADSFDAVICRNALMHFPNPVKALTEMRRVVQSEGKIAVMVHSSLEKNPYHGIPFAVIRRLGNLPAPTADEHSMYALGDPGRLEDVYNKAALSNVRVHVVPRPRHFLSAANAVGGMRKTGREVKELMSRLNEADQERAWTEIAEQLKHFEGPNGLEIPGEVLIGVGSK